MKFRNLNEAYYDAKEINEFLRDKFKSFDDFKEYVKTVSPSIFGKVRPKNKRELKRIVDETIAKEGDNADLNFIDTSLITDMSFIFAGMSGFNGRIDQWDTSNVTDMLMMFNGAKSFNQDISKWNVSKVKIMAGMFQLARSFNQPLNNWDVSNVTVMKYMFSGAKSFNQPLNNWDTSSAYDIEDMFRWTKLEKSKNLPDWYKE